MAISHAQIRSSRLGGVLTFRLAIGLMLLAAFATGMIAWAASTRPADPLNRYAGFGFEDSGSSLLKVGQPAIFSAFLLGDTATSRATVTGVILPRIRGVRLHVYAVTGEPQGNFIGPFTGDSGDIQRSQLVPAIGRSLHPLAGAARTTRWGLTIALVATPIAHGCFPITGVGIRYRVGDTTFTKRMDGNISVATGHRFCAG
ncbi:MAG TPA: hypothetical protein VGL44_15960 [Gaiellales bacterium]